MRTKGGKIMMGGDRRASYGWDYAQNLPLPKIIKRGDFLIGGTGDCSLLTLILDNFYPSLGSEDLTTDLHYRIKTSLSKLLKEHGFKDEHNLLRLQSNTELQLLLGVGGRAFVVDFTGGHNPDTLIEPSVITIDETALPFAVGCGSMAAITSLLKDKELTGYNKKEHLIEAIQWACRISPGCGLAEGQKPDIIVED